MYWFAIFMNILLILALAWMWVVIIKLFLNKEYRNCPPYVPSFGHEKRIIVSRVTELLKNADRKMKILDPGCGTGSLIIDLAKKFPEHEFVGIEWNRLASNIARYKTRKLKNVTILQQDMFTHSFKDADVIVCFLMQPLMERFGNKVKEDAKSGLVIFSNSFYIPNIELAEKIETGKFFFIENVYIYKL